MDDLRFGRAWHGMSCGYVGEQRETYVEECCPK